MAKVNSNFRGCVVNVIFRTKHRKSVAIRQLFKLALQVMGK